MRLSCTLPHLLGLSLIFQMEIPDYWAQCLPAQSKTCHRRFGSWKAEPQTWENVCCVTHRGTFVTSTAGLRAVAHLDMAGKRGRSLHFVGSSLPRLPPSFPPAVVREHIWVHNPASQARSPSFLWWSGPVCLLQYYKGAFMRFTPCKPKVFIRNTPSSLSFMINNVYWCSLPSVK